MKKLIIVLFISLFYYSIGIAAGPPGSPPQSAVTIDDSPSDGNTTEAASSNSVYDHTVSTTAHGLNATVNVTGTSSLSDANVIGTVVSNYGMGSGGDTTLPAYSGNIKFTILVEAATQAWSLKPPSGEIFVLDGAALDANDEIDIGQTVGNSAVLIRLRTGASSYQWYFYSVQGSHTDGGAS